ncbi:hypothetical protein HDV05_004606 [Chytridiales sp. JEL 0842]|nr:hypothetical protein HDV05_004606 [Chytridiales sp. JEL 0842]
MPAIDATHLIPRGFNSYNKTGGTIDPGAIAVIVFMIIVIFALYMYIKKNLIYEPPNVSPSATNNAHFGNVNPVVYNADGTPYSNSTYLTPTYQSSSPKTEDVTYPLPAYVRYEYPPTAASMSATTNTFEPPLGPPPPPIEKETPNATATVFTPSSSPPPFTPEVSGTTVTEANSPTVFIPSAGPAADSSAVFMPPTGPPPQHSETEMNPFRTHQS